MRAWTAILFWLLSSAAANADDIKTWGLAAAIAVEFYDEPFIQKSSLQGDQKLVVIEESTKSEPSFWAVGNWSVDDCDAVNWLQAARLCTNYIKPGIFVGAKLIGNDGAALDGVALGFQWAFLGKKSVGSAAEKEEAHSSSWNIGIGYAAHKTQRFVDGIHENQPLPSDFSQIVYRKRSEWSWILMISRNIR